MFNLPIPFGVRRPIRLANYGTRTSAATTVPMSFLGDSPSTLEPPNLPAPLSQTPLSRRVIGNHILTPYQRPLACTTTLLPFRIFPSEWPPIFQTSLRQRTSPDLSCERHSSRKWSLWWHTGVCSFICRFDRSWHQQANTGLSIRYSRRACTMATTRHYNIRRPWWISWNRYII